MTATISISTMDNNIANLNEKISNLSCDVSGILQNTDSFSVSSLGKLSEEVKNLSKDTTYISNQTNDGLDEVRNIRENADNVLPTITNINTLVKFFLQRFGLPNEEEADACDSYYEDD